MAEHAKLHRDLALGCQIVMKIDDFNWTSIRAMPIAANSPKFSQAHTVANVAVKVFPERQALTADADTFIIPHCDDLTWIEQEIFPRTRSELVSYIDARGVNPAQQQGYNYATASKSAALTNFVMINCFSNKMKSRADYTVVFQTLAEFFEKHVPDHTTVLIAGDFYVWKWSLTALYDSVGTHPLRHRLAPVPDLLHIAVNLQEAVFRFSFDIFQPLIKSAMPEAEKIQLATIKQRPARRVALLTMILRGWAEARTEILRAGSSQWNNPAARVISVSLRWLLDEALPLSLDALGIFGTGDQVSIRGILQRMLPVFMRLNKTNYINIIIFLIGYLVRHPDMDIKLCSSEDLEVFHSVLRASTKHFDTEDQVALQAVYLTARRSSDCWRFLTIRKELQDTMRTANDLAHGLGGFSLANHPTKPRGYFEDAERAVERLRANFIVLFAALKEPCTVSWSRTRKGESEDQAASDDNDSDSDS
ncbi:hypothetical protein HKX48_001331, partial [Thoreauomyces humboldtii]